jgi:hypothetical protein
MRDLLEVVLVLSISGAAVLAALWAAVRFRLDRLASKVIGSRTILVTVSFGLLAAALGVMLGFVPGSMMVRGWASTLVFSGLMTAFVGICAATPGDARATSQAATPATDHGDYKNAA